MSMARRVQPLGITNYLRQQVDVNQKYVDLLIHIFLFQIQKISMVFEQIVCLFIIFAVIINNKTNIKYEKRMYCCTKKNHFRHVTNDLHTVGSHGNWYNCLLPE